MKSKMPSGRTDPWKVTSLCTMSYTQYLHPPSSSEPSPPPLLRRKHGLDAGSWHQMCLEDRYVLWKFVHRVAGEPAGASQSPVQITRGADC